MGLLDDLPPGFRGGLLNAPISLPPLQSTAPFLIPTADRSLRAAVSYNDPIRTPLLPASVSAGLLGVNTGHFENPDSSSLSQRLQPNDGMPAVSAMRPSNFDVVAPLLIPPIPLVNGFPNWWEPSSGSPKAGFFNDSAAFSAPSYFQAAAEQTTPIAYEQQALTARHGANISAATGTPRFTNQSANQAQTSKTAQLDGLQRSRNPEPFHLAQLFALPPVSLFARPPIGIPRQLRPLEELPKGSAGGPRAGKPFPRGLNRDEPEGTPCTYCGRPTNKGQPSDPQRHNGDHIIPRRQGGNGDDTNRTPACRECNAEKSGRAPEQWYNDRQRSVPGDEANGEDSL